MSTPRDLRNGSTAARAGGWLAAVSLSLAVTGCGIDIELIIEEHQPPREAVVDEDGVRLPLGTALGVRVTDDGDDIDGTIELSSAHNDMLRVFSTPEHDVFVLTAVGEGDTFMQAIVDGEWEEDIPVTITPQ